MAEGRGATLWDDRLLGAIYLGDETFIQTMQNKIVSRPENSEVPRLQRECHRHPLSHYLGGAEPDRAIVRAHLQDGYSQADIARATGWSPARISRLIARHRARSKT